MTEKRSPVFFQEKIEVAPSVAAPGHTHPSDALTPLLVGLIIYEIASNEHHADICNVM